MAADEARAARQARRFPEATLAAAFSLLLLQRRFVYAAFPRAPYTLTKAFHAALAV
jgi:hypothetical protein